MVSALLSTPLILALLLASVGAHAQTDWSRLSPQQRSVLAPLERDWSRATPAQQQKWLEVAGRYNSLPADERQRMQQRMSEWSQLSAPERARARLNFQEARQIGREERQQQWEAYRALPPERRRALLEQAQSSNAPAPVRGRSPESGAKSNLVRGAALPPPQPVGPSVVQRGAGATTNLVSRPAAPPLHQQAGLPKVTATPGFVDDATLLPRRGAQGAGVRAPERSDTRSNGKSHKQR